MDESEQGSMEILFYFLVGFRNHSNVSSSFGFSPYILRSRRCPVVSRFHTVRPSVRPPPGQVDKSVSYRKWGSQKINVLPYRQVMSYPGYFVGCVTNIELLSSFKVFSSRYDYVRAELFLA